MNPTGKSRHHNRQISARHDGQRAQRHRRIRCWPSVGHNRFDLAGNRRRHRAIRAIRESRSPRPEKTGRCNREQIVRPAWAGIQGNAGTIGSPQYNCNRVPGIVRRAVRCSRRLTRLFSIFDIAITPLEQVCFALVFQTDDRVSQGGECTSESFAGRVRELRRLDHRACFLTQWQGLRLSLSLLSGLVPFVSFLQFANEIDDLFVQWLGSRDH